MSAQIQMLPDPVINKIAAGEVIERPASVVKELVENAIDAGATQVDVEVVRGGMQLMAISDNGSGMDRDNALMAIERHATSKIRTAEHVEAVSTMGFRGEALAAISSVSRFTLTTRPHDQNNGTEVRIAGGKLLDVADAGCPPGTRMEVRNLFFNVPARRKFLRTEATELAQIRQLFCVYALSHPEMGLSLRSDGRELYNLAAADSLSGRIQALYGSSTFSHLRKLDLETDAVSIGGYAGLPQTGRKDRSDQYIFVNGRPASAAVIYHAINQAYHSVLAKGRHPSVFLFVDVPPALVDVNVHPAKKEVRFRHPSAVRDAVGEAIAAALALEKPAEEKRAPVFPFSVPPVAPPKQEAQHELKIEVQSDKGTKQQRESEETETPEAQGPKPSSPWQWCRVLGLAGDYAVLETADGVVLMDPRAAHERVLFEQFMDGLTDGKPAQQRLLTPETVELMPADADALRSNLEVLEEMGFGVSDFGQDTFAVDALPVYLQDGAPSVLLAEISSALYKGGAKSAAHEALREIVAKAACRSAVKSRDGLSEKELDRLVSDLAATEMPYTSPQGRPTLIFQSFTELNRKFGR